MSSTMLDAPVRRPLDQLMKLAGSPSDFLHIPDRTDRLMALAIHRAALVAEAAGVNVWGDPIYTTADVIGWINRALRMGATFPSLGPRTVAKVYRQEIVPNAILRDRALALGLRHEPGEGGTTEHPHDDDADRLTCNALARAIGATRTRSDRRTATLSGDPARVMRMLGIWTTPGAGGRPPSVRLFVTYDQAVRLADALDVSYHDLGI